MLQRPHLSSLVEQEIKETMATEGFDSDTHEIVSIFIICMAQILNQAGSTQSLPMMNILGDEFSGVTPTDKVWFMASFPLTAGAFILISGKFGDLYGLKRSMLFGLVWGMIWTLITGLTSYTNSVVFFCICRALHGIGLAFVLPNAIGIIGTLYQNGSKKKSAVFCLVGAMAPIGAALGSIFSAVISEKGHWPWAYYSNSICFAILAVATYIYIPNIPRHAAPEVTFDWLGSITGVTGLVLFNFSWNQAPAVGWDNPYIIVLLIVGFLSILAFFQIEKRVKYPLIPKEIMNSHILLILSAVGFGWGSFSIYVFYFWCLLMNINGWSPIHTGFTYFTFALFGVIAAFSVNVFIRRVRPSYLLLAATCAFLIGITMLSQTPPHQMYWHMLFPQMVILSFGMDISFPAASLVLSEHLPKKHQGMASSLVSTMINYSMSITLGFAGTAEAQILKRNTSTYKGYQAAMYVGVGLAVLGCILALVLHTCSYIWPHQEEVDLQIHKFEDDSDVLENSEPVLHPSRGGDNSTAKV